MMRTEQHEDLDRAADVVARRYARRVWWADVEDLRQEARMVIESTYRNWDPSVGVSRYSYVSRAAALHLRRYLLRQSSPVSASHHYCDHLREHRRVPVTRCFDDGAEEEWLSSGEEPQDVAVDDARWSASVRRSIAIAVGSIEYADAVGAIITAERRAAEVAAELGVAVESIYRATRRVKAIMSANVELYELWRNK